MLGSDGRPVRGAVLAIRERELEFNGPENAIEVFSDVRGRARFVVERRKWRVAILDPAACEYAIRDFDATTRRRLQVTLERMPRFTVHCLRAGKPVAGRRATLSPNATMHNGHFSREASAWNKSIEAISDARGQLEIPFWPMQAAEFTIFVAEPGQGPWAGLRIPFTANGGDRSVELKIPR